MVTTLLLAQSYTTENLIGVRIPMLNTQQFPGTAGTVTALHTIRAQMVFTVVCFSVSDG